MVILFGEYFFDRLAIIKEFASTLKVFFHEIDEAAIFTLVNSWILNNKTAIFVKGFSNYLAICLGGCRIG